MTAWVALPEAPRALALAAVIAVWDACAGPAYAQRAPPPEPVELLCTGRMAESPAANGAEAERFEMLMRFDMADQSAEVLHSPGYDGDYTAIPSNVGRVTLKGRHLIDGQMPLGFLNRMTGEGSLFFSTKPKPGLQNRQRMMVKCIGARPLF